MKIFGGILIVLSVCNILDVLVKMDNKENFPEKAGVQFGKTLLFSGYIVFIVLAIYMT